VTTRKNGSAVIYSLTSPLVAELLAVARRIMTEVLTGQVELLEDIAAPAAAAEGGPRSAAPGG
jgi:ArsR family transcriptional regulator